MEAQVWTLIAVLIAALLGVLFEVGVRMDGFAARLDRLIDTVDSRLARVSMSLERMERHFEGLDQRVAHVDRRFDRLETRLGGLEGQGARLADSIYSVAQKLDEHLRRHAS